MDCSICNDHQEEIIPALGHDVDFTITLQPTCTEAGKQNGICNRCGEEVEEQIEPTGHDYPEEWEIIKEPTYFAKGEKIRKCNKCGEIESQDIGKIPIPPLIIIGSAGGVAAIATIAILLKKKAAKKIAEEVVKDAVETKLFKPSFEDKTIVTCMEDDDFYTAMKFQKYIQVVESEYDALSESIKENEPSLTIIDISKLDIEDVKTNIEGILAENEEAKITLLLKKQQIKDHKELLEQMKKDKLVYNYGSVETNYKVNLVKLVLPVMKPDLHSDESLENLGKVADVLNIPFVSTLISTYTSGRDIKDTIKDADEDGLSFVDKATIVSDLASILGLDKVASVAGLVGDVDDIKSSLEAKMGGNEFHTTKDAVEDFVDVVSDIID